MRGRCAGMSRGLTRGRRRRLGSLAFAHGRRTADRRTEGAAPVALAPGDRNRRPRCRSRAAGSAGREEYRVPQALVDHGGPHRPAFLHRADEASRTRRATERLAAEPHTARSANEPVAAPHRSEEHTAELPSLMRIAYALFRLEQNRGRNSHTNIHTSTTSLDKPTRPTAI